MNKKVKEIMRRMEKSRPPKTIKNDSDFEKIAEPWYFTHY